MASWGGSDVGGSAFEPWPVDAQVHVEWGPQGARLAGDRGDVVVVVDVLSFSTSVVLVAMKGGTALSYSFEELERMGGRERAAALLDADIVTRDRSATTGRFSLSPASLSTVTPGDRVVFTSLNGAVVTAAAHLAPVVVVGALTNAGAVASTVASMLGDGVAGRCTLVPCGERWTLVGGEPDALRPGIEDLLGVGAIAHALSGLVQSSEAELAAAAYRAVEGRLADVLRRSVSGRELIERGFPDDVELAAAVDSSGAVPRWDTGQTLREFTTGTEPA